MLPHRSGAPPPITALAPGLCCELFGLLWLPARLATDDELLEPHAASSNAKAPANKTAAAQREALTEARI